jgi:Flp pilus assembly protein TadD
VTATTEFIDYYELLHVPITADPATIEKAVKEQQRIWRKRQGTADLAKRQEAELRMKHLADARTVLLDPDQRARYDRQLATRPRPSTGTEPVSGSGQAVNWLERARAYMAVNDYHSAVYAAREATHLDGGSALAWNVRAGANAGLGRLEDATFEARQAVDLEPTNPQYHFDLGCVLEERRRWTDAIGAYQAAADLDPGNFIYPLSVAGVYLQNDAPREALPRLERLHHLYPSEPLVNCYLAGCLLAVAEQVPRIQRRDSYLASSPEELVEMEELVERAAALPHGDQDLAAEVDGMRRYLVGCRKIRFSPPPWLASFGPRGMFIVFIVPVFFLLGGLGGIGQAPGPALATAALSGLAIYGLIRACWVPVWKINARIGK